MSAKKTTKNKMHIDKALGEMIDAANPALKKITGNRYRIPTDPAEVIKYCIKNWEQLRSDLEPNGITLRKLKSARRVRNDSSHWDPEVAIDSKSHRDASVIYELKDAFTKINRANPNKSRQTKPEQPKQQTPNKPQQTRPQPTNPRRESQRQQQPMRKERQHARPKKSNRAMELGITLIAVPSAPMLIIAATGSEIPEYLLTFGGLSILAGGLLVAKGMHTRKN